MAACLLPAGAVRADFPDTLGSLSQQQFIRLAKNLSAATHYKSISPAEELGTFGLDIGAELSTTELDEPLFDEASGGSFGSDKLLVPRIHVHKGLPLGLDIGASLGKVGETDITLIGGELRYNLMHGNTLAPAVAIRASYSQLQGITDLDLNSAALELTVSKGFFMLTPYAGAGIVRTNANPNPEEPGELRADTFDQEKFYVGLTLNLGFAVTLEAEKTGDFQTYSAKAGLRF